MLPDNAAKPSAVLDTCARTEEVASVKGTSIALQVWEGPKNQAHMLSH